MAINSQSMNFSSKTHTATDMFDNERWFKAKREQVREFCLDQNDSLIWDFVNRSVFEKITSPHTDSANCSKYGPYITLFYRIATLFYYNHINNHSIHIANNKQ